MALQLAPGAWASAGGVIILGGGGGGSGSTPALDAVLVEGNTTGGTDVVVSAGDAVLFTENAAVPWTPAAGLGTYWVRDDAPNVPVFTDDAGADNVLAYSGAAPTAHATSHENGGGDEINVGGLSGVLADNQPAIPADGLDTSAIHDDVAGEIAAVTAKATPVTGDFILIEDSAAANAKKSITIGDLPAAAPAAHAASHEDGGSDEITIENLATGESDTSFVLNPDGAGGVAWNAAAGGGGGTELDANATSENLKCSRTNQTPTVSATDPGQVNLGSESVASHGTSADYATIGGGLNNIVASNFATVCGGEDNDVSSTSAEHSVICGGRTNLINASSSYNTIVGGTANSIRASNESSFIGGGNNCDITNGTRQVICGGFSNQLTNTTGYSFIGGGSFHDVAADYCVVAGGINCNITNAAGDYAVIGGGNQNNISASDSYDTISGGQENTIAGTSSNSTIPGGNNNTITSADYAVAGGRRAQISHDGVLLFADSTAADVDSQEADQAHFGCQEGVRLSHTTEEDGAVWKVRELQTTDSADNAMFSETLDDNSAMLITARIVGMESDGSDRATYILNALVYRDGGGATIQGSVDRQLEIESDVNWDANISVTSNDVEVTVNGNGDTVEWRATIQKQRVA